MLPKAAFQFGVKNSDGRKGHRQLGNKPNRDSRLKSDMKEIKKIMEKDGRDYSRMFSAGPKDSSGGGEVQGAKAKKRRI